MTTTKCQSCESERIIFLYSHASDLHSVSIPHLDYEHDGYLPHIPNIGSGDDVDMEICLECGQVQGDWSVSDSVFLEDDEDYFGDDDKWTDEDDQAQIEKLRDLDDIETEAFLGANLYDKNKLLDSKIENLEDTLKDEVLLWLRNNTVSWKINENDSGEWGSIIFFNRYDAARFSDKFGVTWHCR